MGGSEKVQNSADVIYAWSLMIHSQFLKYSDKEPSIYYVSKELGGWVSFADVQYRTYADVVGGLVRKSPK